MANRNNENIGRCEKLDNSGNMCGNLRIKNSLYCKKHTDLIIREMRQKDSCNYIRDSGNENYNQKLKDGFKYSNDGG